MAGSNGTEKKRQQNPIESTPISCYLNGGLGGLALWPWSLFCQHFGWFVCDFIRNQNNSQMKRKIAYAKCCCITGAVFAFNTHSPIHTGSQEHIKHSITVKVIGTNTRLSVDKCMNACFLRKLMSEPDAVPHRCRVLFSVSFLSFFSTWNKGVKNNEKIMIF